MPTETHQEQQYLDLLKDILQNGSDKEVFYTPEVLAEYKSKNQTPPSVRSVFGRQMRFDLSKGFPLLTTKKVFWRGIVHELLWFLSGSSNIKYLVDNDIHIWDEWAYKKYFKFCTENFVPAVSSEEFFQKFKSEPADSPFVKKWGDLVTIYGKMWRAWPASDGRTIDQLGWVIEGLKSKPFRKSYVVSSWNPDFIYGMASKGNSSEVPPFCHTLFQFQVTGEGTLNLSLYQRSGDMFLGIPFNIASYALLLQIVAQVTGLKTGEFVHFLGDAHIYSNHKEQVDEQLTRTPNEFPQVKLNPNKKELDTFTYEDIELVGYNPHPALKAEVAVVGGF